MVAYVLDVLWRSGGTAVAYDGSAPGAILPDYRSYVESVAWRRGPGKHQGYLGPRSRVPANASQCAHQHHIAKKRVIHTRTDVV